MTCSVSSSDASSGNASISVRGVITSRAFFSENSNTPSIMSASVASSTPPSSLCSTRIRSSSGECTASSSGCGRWPKTRNTNTAELLSTIVNGRTILSKILSGGARKRANRSGCASATLRGASSPNTTCRYVTKVIARADAIAIRTASRSVMGRVSNQSVRCAPSVSSASAPSARLATVIPSWLADKRRGRLPVARSATRASLSPARAIASSFVRRDRTSANSAATKKAFSASSTTMAIRRVITDCKLP